MSSQQLSRSSSRSEGNSVEMAEENKPESQKQNVPKNRQENSTAETADVKSKHKQNADGKDTGKHCKGHTKRHGPRFMHHQPGFYGPRMFDTIGGQHNSWQTDDLGDEATEEYEQFYGYEQQDPTEFQEYKDEGAVGGEYAGPGPWHRFQHMGPMRDHGPNILRDIGWWRRMMADQNAMPGGQFGPMPGAMGFPGFRGHMGMNRGERKHGPHHHHRRHHHHHHDEEEVVPEMSGDGETFADITPEGVQNTNDASSSSNDEEIEIVTPECCEKETLLQSEGVKKPEENTDDCKGRRKGPRGGPRGGHMRRVMRQCLAMGMLHPFMMKPWLADEDSSESDDKGEKSQNDEETESSSECKKRGKHFRRAMKYRMRMGMFHPFMLKPWVMTDCSSGEDSDIPTEEDSEPKKTKKWQKQKKCRRNAMRECMGMGLLPPGACKPWMFRESSDSEEYSSDSATEGCEPECKGMKKCCRKGKGPRKMWRKIMKRQHRMNAMAGQMGPMMGYMGPRGRMMAGLSPSFGMSPMAGRGPRCGMGLQSDYFPMAEMNRMGPMRGMGPRHGFGPMGGMHSRCPVGGIGPSEGFGPMGGMQRRCPMGSKGPSEGYGPMGGMQRRCPMGGMGPRQGYGPMGGMQRRCAMGGMGPRQGYGPMGPENMMSPWMSPFGMMRPKKFMKIMKKIHKENRKADKECMQKDVNSLSEDFEKGMGMAEKKE